MGLLELLPPCRVRDRLVQGRLGHPDGAGRDAEPPGVEGGERDREALALLADPTGVGDAYAVEVQLGGGRALHAHLLLGRGGVQAGVSPGTR